MNRTFAAGTGQLWKYHVWIVLSVGAGIATLVEVSLWEGNPLGLSPGPATIAYFAITIPWMIWWASAIRCPECGTRVDWHLWSHVPRTDEEEARERLPRGPGCPACGFTPNAPAPGSKAAPAPSVPLPAGPQPGGLRRVRLWGGCFALLLWFEAWAVFTFREWWPSSPMGWLAFLVAAPLALVLFWALGELLGNLLGERFERASLWVSRDDFSLGRIVLGVLVFAAVLVLLIWLEGFLGGPTRF